MVFYFYYILQHVNAREQWQTDILNHSVEHEDPYNEISQYETLNTISVERAGTLDNSIKDFASAGADIITFHPEATRDTAKTIGLIKNEGKKVGISLKPKSKIDLVEKYLIDIDLVLIMSVEPGFGGQKFMPEVLEKTKKLREIIKTKNLKVDIEIDGGINFENCTLAKKAGANILVSGSTIFKENKGDLKKNIEILRKN